MDFQFSEEQKMLRQTLRDFVEKELRPLVESTAVGEGPSVPPECRKKMADLGLFGLCLPSEYGGYERPALDAILAIEEFVQAAYPFSNLVMQANTGPPRIIEKYGLPELKEEILPGVVQGEVVIAPGMTEAEAGSALTDLQTKAILDGDQYIINGTKMFQHMDATHWLVYVRLTEELGARGVGAILVSKDSPGFSLGSYQELMGMRSPRGETIFDNCQVPKENLVVQAGDFRKLIGSFNLERLGNTASCVGLAQRALTIATAYSQERRQFGKEICEFQAIQFMLADMAMKVEAARWLLYRAATNAGREFPPPLEASIAKGFANEMVREVVASGLQIHGGYGYSKEFEIERIFRDAWGWGVGGGTIQMQKVIIASELLGRRFNQRK